MPPEEQTQPDQSSTASIVKEKFDVSDALKNAKGFVKSVGADRTASFEYNPSTGKAKVKVESTSQSYKHKFIKMIDDNLGTTVIVIILIVIGLLGVGGWLRVSIPWNNYFNTICKQISICNGIKNGGLLAE